MNQKEERDYNNFLMMRGVGLGIFEIWFQTLGYVLKAFIVFIIFVIVGSLTITALIVGVRSLHYLIIGILIVPTIFIARRIKHNLSITRKMVRKLEVARMEDQIKLLNRYTESMKNATSVEQYNAYINAFDLAYRGINIKYQNAFDQLSRKRSFASLYAKKNSELLRR